MWLRVGVDGHHCSGLWREHHSRRSGRVKPFTHNQSDDLRGQGLPVPIKGVKSSPVSSSFCTLPAASAGVQLSACETLAGTKKGLACSEYQQFPMPRLSESPRVP